MQKNLISGPKYYFLFYFTSFIIKLEINDG